MKRIVCIVIALVMLISASGCSLVNSRLNQLNKEISSEEDAMEHVETTVVQALENKDEELLKSIFSEKALTKAGDMDKGIEYIFDLYKGDFVEISEENHSTDEHIEKDKSTKDIAAWCIIKTSEETYKMSWVEWTVQEEDPSSVGVYKLQMRKYVEEDYRSYYDIAGINYPERDIAHATVSGFMDAYYDKKEDAFTSLLSDELLAKEGTEEQLNQMNELLSDFFYSDMGVGWVTYDEVDGKEKMHTYYEIFINDKLHIIHFTFDDVEQDKISVFQIAEYDGGDFEEETECGIYLP